jgi:hypothetical protein
VTNGTLKSWVSDARQVAAIITIAGACGAVAWWVVGFVSGAQTWMVAAKQHEEIRLEMRHGDEAVDLKASTAVGAVHAIGKDVRTIKCLLTKTKRKERDACGLDP